MKKGSHYSGSQLERLRATHTTPEFRLKVSIANKGRVRTPEQRKRTSEATKIAMANLPKEVKEKIRTAPIGYRGYWDTHPVSEETKQKIRQAALADRENRSKRLLGANNPMFGRIRELNPNWKGGYPGRYPAEFYTIRPDILKRDDCSCQLCHKPIIEKGMYVTHHIDYDRNNNKESNLIILCRSCHSLLQKSKFRRKVHSLLLIRAVKRIAHKQLRQILG